MKGVYVKSTAAAMTAVLMAAATGIESRAEAANFPDKPAALQQKTGAVARTPSSTSFKPIRQAAPLIPLAEPSLAASPTAGFGSPSVFSAATPNTVTPNAQTLSGPVTLTYSGTSPALSITDGGSGRGMTVSITNPNDGSSALYGDTVGSGARHVGPMAQDFHAAFGLNGADEKHISEVDIGGVSLAAIQELNKALKNEMKTKDGQIAELQAEGAELKAQVAELKAQSAAQIQTMHQLEQAVSARITALERSSVKSQTTALKTHPPQRRVAMN